MLLSLIGTVFSGILAGGATGILGVAFQRFFDYLHVKETLKKEKQQQDFELEKRRIDIQVTQAEWAGRVKVADTEASAAKDVAESNAFAASLFKEPERYSTGTTTAGQQWVLVLLDALRGSVRPLLTIYLCVLVTMLWIEARTIVGKEDLSTAEAVQLMQTIVGSIIYVWTTCTLWWFGTRNRQKQPGAA